LRWRGRDACCRSGNSEARNDLGWPVSRILSRASSPELIIHLCDLPELRRAALSARSGLAPGEVCLAGVSPRSLVRSCRTVSPLPVAPHGRPSAVCFLLHWLAGCPGSPLATTLLCGVRTFLDAPARDAAISQPSKVYAPPSSAFVRSLASYLLLDGPASQG